MTSRFLVGCKYTKRGCIDQYIEVMSCEDFEDYFKMHIVWRSKSTDKPAHETPHLVCVSRNSLHEWSPWLK